MRYNLISEGNSKFIILIPSCLNSALLTPFLCSGCIPSLLFALVFTFSLNVQIKYLIYSFPFLTLSLSIHSYCVSLSIEVAAPAFFLAFSPVLLPPALPTPSVTVYIVVTFVHYPGCWLPAVLLCDLTAALPRMGPFIRSKEQEKDTCTHTCIQTH